MKSDFNKIVKGVRDAGWDWLIRSNTPPHTGGNYFANITYGSSVRADGSYNPNFRSFPAYGKTHDEALRNSYHIFKIGRLN